MAKSSSTVLLPQLQPVEDTGEIDGPSGIRVRMYRVGFGDFFLLSLRRDEHI